VKALVQRVVAMLIEPAAEWARIERESGDPAILLGRYVALLALIPALAAFIGASIIGATLPDGGIVRAPIFDGLFGAIFGYVVAFVTVLLLALAIDALGPMFGGQRNFRNALMLAVYSYTPIWLAGVFLLLPGLRFLALTGFYSAYLLWAGLPLLMKSSEQKSQTYTAAIVVAACALTVLFAVIQRTVFGTPSI
jgi:hypothetical protein